MLIERLSDSKSTFFNWKKDSIGEAVKEKIDYLKLLLVSNSISYRLAGFTSPAGFPCFALVLAGLKTALLDSYLKKAQKEALQLDSWQLVGN